MTQNEFMNMIEQVMRDRKIPKGRVPMLSDSDYRIIEYVYAFHPSIRDSDGKRQMAELYVEYGMALIRDMMARAQLMEEKEAELKEAKGILERIQNELVGISRGSV